MTSSLSLLTSADLRQLAGALRSGRVGTPYTALSIRRHVPDGLAEAIAADLGRMDQRGMKPEFLANTIDLIVQDRSSRPLADDLIDLVWTGPEAAGTMNRDTAVVVRELFQSARESVLVAGYAVYQGRVVFRALAERMEEVPSLRVTMFLDIQRPPNDGSTESELVRRFAARFVEREWPGKRRPSLYFDPRSLATVPGERSSMHAKCVVVDKERALVSSANFTEAAQTRNIEVGVQLRSPAFAKRLAEHFEALAAAAIMKPIPLGSFNAPA